MNSLIYTRFPKVVRWGFMFLAIGLATFIFVQSLTPIRVSFNLHNTDKILHFGAYLILAGLSLPGFARLKPLITLILVAGFGGVIEVLQGLASTGRSADIWDFFANSLGVVCAFLAWWVLTLLWRKLRA